MASVGTIALYFALITTIYAIVTAYVGGKKGQQNYLNSSRGATLSSFLLVLMAAGVLIYGLVTHDFRLAYVADYTSRDLPLLYRVSAFWAGQAGSLLLWLLIISGMTLILQYRQSYRVDRMDLQTVSLMNLARLFFLFLLVTVVSPFKTADPVPLDGMGLNPMLQSLGMVVHPPILFLGYSGFLVPFVIVAADLLFKRKEAAWGEKTRPWVLFSWLMLSAGIVTGGNWAYTELGWGGYWAWDPVENASLFPWLTSTALLHTLMIQRQQKGMKVWNYLLIALTFILTIFGTFLTRSGILDSVHAFGDNQLGQYFLLLLIGLLVFTLFLLLFRYPQLKSPKREMGILSKEVGLIVTNILLLLICLGVFLGTVFPLISTLLMGRKVTLDQIFYNQVTIPFWLSLAVLMGICPVLSWKRTEGVRFRNMLLVPGVIGVGTAVGLYLAGLRQGMAVLSFGIAAFVAAAVAADFLLGVREYRRQQGMSLPTAALRFLAQRRQRYGAYIVHIGVIVILVGITGSLFQQEVTQTLQPGDVVSIDSYRLAYAGLETRTENGYTHVGATLTVYENEKVRGTVHSEKVFHARYRQPATEVGILSSLRDDLYFNLAGWDGDTAHVQVSLHPLTSWIWVGSYLLYFGVFVILWPRKRRTAAA